MNASYYIPRLLFLSLVSTSFSGSKIEHWSGAANLTCTIEESVPSSAKLGLKYVLFLLIRLDTLSSSALECVITRTSLATVESSRNLGSPVAREDMPHRWDQTTSILRTLVLGSCYVQLFTTLWNVFSEFLMDLVQKDWIIPATKYFKPVNEVLYICHISKFPLLKVKKHGCFQKWIIEGHVAFEVIYS